MMEATTSGFSLIAKRHLDNTQAIRLLIALGDWKCPRCATADPKVVSTQGNIRYVKCRVPNCGGKGKIVL